MKILQQAVSEFHFRGQNSSSFPNSLYISADVVALNRIVVVDLQLLMQSLPLTINVCSSNSARGEMYSIQHYVKFVRDL
jgi:hypothetical protein